MIHFYFLFLNQMWGKKNHSDKLLVQKRQELQKRSLQYTNRVYMNIWALVKVQELLRY